MSSCRLSFVGRARRSRRSSFPNAHPGYLQTRWSDRPRRPCQQAQDRTARQVPPRAVPRARDRAQEERRREHALRPARWTSVLPFFFSSSSLERSTDGGRPTLCACFLRRADLQPKGVLCRAGGEGLVGRPAEGPSGHVERCASFSSSFSPVACPTQADSFHRSRLCRDPKTGPGETRPDLRPTPRSRSRFIDDPTRASNTPHPPLGSWWVSFGS